VDGRLDERNTGTVSQFHISKDEMKEISIDSIGDKERGKVWSYGYGQDFHTYQACRIGGGEETI